MNSQTPDPREKKSPDTNSFVHRRRRSVNFGGEGQGKMPEFWMIFVRKFFFQTIRTTKHHLTTLSSCICWSPCLARSLLFFVVDSVCVFVCHAPSNCFFFFVSQWNRAIFGRQLKVWHSTKTLFFDFWFRPPNAQNLFPKSCTKSRMVYKSACMADRPKMFGPTRGFRGWSIQWNHAKCCGADACCHGNDIWPRRGDLVAYRLVVLMLS